MYNQAHWDLYSLVIYVLFALLGGICIKYIFRNSSNNRNKCFFFIIWFISWELIAVYRKIGNNIGGADSLAYIKYFEHCLRGGEIYQLQSHFGADLLFRYLNQIIRLFTNNYHFLFFVIYAILIISYYCVLKGFDNKKYSCIPYFIVFYIYLRGFVTIRTNLAVAMILFSLCSWGKNNKKRAVVFAIASIFFQKASVLYAVILVYLYLVEKKGISLFKCFLGICVMGIGGKFLQYIIANFNISFLDNGAYRYYALNANQNSSFLDGYWKIAFSQLLLILCVVILRKDIKKYEESIVNVEEAYKFRLVKLICYFDIMTVPVTFLLNIWRGYEYLYMFRLVMWGCLIQMILMKFKTSNQKVLKIIFWGCFIGWMVFRINSTWEDSALMPFSLDFT